MLRPIGHGPRYLYVRPEKMRNSFLIILVIIMQMGCSQDNRSSDINRLFDSLPNQTGDTIGYPYWENRIIKFYPAKELIKLGDIVVDRLIEKISDNTKVACLHLGRSSQMQYTVGDVAIYILAKINTKKSRSAIEEAIKQMKDGSLEKMTAALAYKPDDVPIRGK